MHDRSLEDGGRIIVTSLCDQSLHGATSGLFVGVTGANSEYSDPFFPVSHGPILADCGTAGALRARGTSIGNRMRAALSEKHNTVAVDH